VSAIKFLDVAQRVVLGALLVPVVIIVMDAALTFFEGREDNEIVGFFGDNAETLTPIPVEDMFADQADWQTALLALIAYGIVALMFLLLFKALRAVVASVES
jgi:hypothetical protein